MAVDLERHFRTIAALSISPLDALICASATEVLLLTGYWPIMSASVVVFTSSGHVQVIVPEDEVELAEKTSSAEIIPYKTGGLHTLESAITLLKKPLGKALAKFNANSRIGIRSASGVQPASYAVSTVFRSSLAELLAELLPEASFASCDDLLEEMKTAKTAKELEILHIACRAAAAGFAGASKCIDAGLRECEVATNAQSAFEKTHDADALERSYGYYFCMSGPNSATAAAAYARTRRRSIEEGDLVMIHANTCADGYWTDVTRTYAVGVESNIQQEMRFAIDTARAAGLRSIKPGVKAKDVDHAVRSVMDSAGFGKAFKHATGHGVGFAAANPNARPRIHPLSPDVLEIGMTFNLEPAAYFEGSFGMRHCDVIEVTSIGATVITDF